MDRFIAYYRVSSDRQGQSGLGLAAQQASVMHYLAGRGELLAEYIEVESGSRNDRPQLQAALAECREQPAILVIAKLDRLARNVYFIAGLMESGVDFVAVDMPQANRLTLHILAAVAEHERELIRQRTREALAAAKRRGIRLGSPKPAKGGQVTGARHHLQALEHAAQVLPHIERLRAQGLRSLRELAEGLNEAQVPTAQGGRWFASTVRNVLCRNKEEKSPAS